MDDLTELLKRIYEHSHVYRESNVKSPLFRLTPHEYKIFKEHILRTCNFLPEYFGHLPTYMNVNFELVGEPQLFNGAHIRSDSGIEFYE